MRASMVKCSQKKWVFILTLSLHDFVFLSYKMRGFFKQFVATERKCSYHPRLHLCQISVTDRALLPAQPGLAVTSLSTDCLGQPYWVWEVSWRDRICLLRWFLISFLPALNICNPEQQTPTLAWPNIKYFLISLWLLSRVSILFQWISHTIRSGLFVFKQKLDKGMRSKSSSIRWG